MCVCVLEGSVTERKVSPRVTSHLLTKLPRVILKICRIPIVYIVNSGVLERGNFPIGYIINCGALERSVCVCTVGIHLFMKAYITFGYKVATRDPQNLQNSYSIHCQLGCVRARQFSHRLHCQLGCVREKCVCVCTVGRHLFMKAYITFGYKFATRDP